MWQDSNCKKKKKKMKKPKTKQKKHTHTQHKQLLIKKKNWEIKIENDTIQCRNIETNIRWEMQNLSKGLKLLKVQDNLSQNSNSTDYLPKPKKWN